MDPTLSAVVYPPVTVAARPRKPPPDDDRADDIARARKGQPGLHHAVTQLFLGGARTGKTLLLRRRERAEHEWQPSP